MSASCSVVWKAAAHTCASTSTLVLLPSDGDRCSVDEDRRDVLSEGAAVLSVRGVGDQCSGDGAIRSEGAASVSVNGDGDQ